MNGVALVTGGGRGLGRAFAIALAGAGMDVAVAARSVDELDETVAALQLEGHRGIAIGTDVSDEAAVTSMLQRAEQALGSIDLLINCAGVAGPFGPTWQAGSDEWWRTFEVNVKGPMLCSKAVAKGMIERRHGRIINVASGAGTIGIPYMSAYVSAKCALIRFTEVLAEELREHGVFAFAIQPGTVRTAMAEQLLQSEAGKRWLPWFKRIFDEGRDDSTSPAAELVLHLAAGKADELSGRLFAAPGSPMDLAGKTNEIIEKNLGLLRLRYW